MPELLTLSVASIVSSVQGILSFVLSIAFLKAIIAFAFLILVHELGHYFAAKAIGVRVERLSIGFGHKLIGATWRGTEYWISSFPLGGYVKFYGELEDSAKEKDAPELAAGDPESFLNQPPWKRAFVCVAGPAVNFLVAIPILMIALMHGINVPEPKIGEPINPDSPLFRAGIEPGDLVLAVNDCPVDSLQRLKEELVLTGPKRPISLLVDRAGQRHVVKVTEPGTLVSRSEPPMFFTATIGVVEPGSPAEKAGLKKGDRLVRVDHMPVDHWTPALSQYIAARPGKTLNVRVERTADDGSVEPQEIAVPVSSVEHWRLGVRLIPSTAIGQVEHDGPAARAGLRKGDRVLEVDGRPTPDFAAISQIVRQSAGKLLELTIDRKGRELRLSVTPEPAQGQWWVGLTLLPAPVVQEVNRSGPAYETDLRPGDRVLEIDGEPVPHFRALDRRVRQSAGKTLDLLVARGGQKIHVPVTPEEGPTGDGWIGIIPNAAVLSATVGDVAEHGPAQQAGLAPGDLLKSINGESVADPGRLHRAIAECEGKPIVLTVDRGGQEMDVTVTPQPEGRIGIGSTFQPPAIKPQPASTAEHVGLQRGDIPVRFGDRKIRKWDDLVAAVQAAKGTESVLVVRRGREELSMSIAAHREDDGDVGFGLDPALRFTQLRFFRALRQGATETVGIAMLTYRFLGKLITGQVKPRYLSGPAGIVYVVTFKAREGLSELFSFVALITVNLAILNLLPLPILDGGQIVFLVIEKIMGRRLPVSVQIGVQYVGLFLLLGLMLLATSNDLRNFFLGS